MSEEVKLKPCPYCGKDAFLRSGDNDFGRVTLGCNTYYEFCKLHPTLQMYRPDKEAIEAWNKRPIENELQAKIDELTKERDDYKAKLDFINSERYQEFQKERKEIKERHEKLRKRLDY